MVDVEDFLADAVQGVGQDVAQGRDDFAAQDGAGFPGDTAQVADEVAGQALKVAQCAEVMA